MDLQFVWMIFKTLLALLCVVLLIYISLKYGGAKFQSIQKGKFIRILERSQLSKDNAIFVVKIGEKVCVISSTAGRIEIVHELNEEEILKLKKREIIPEYKNLKDFYRRSGMEKFIKNLVAKKEDRHE
ncbi:MAG: flagellar biosynthetic protein FliO [Clostridium sp.]|jgi:flagellar protein FliO/FliZ|uniref:flagellar biosynthetic protein FliO n=1 Tax=Clostridium sp. TaxID=1506 RepID=UPI0025C5C2F8|nr:flagellar biosynthetic protein FliO [Clostridium sp.]MCH3964215.1 flagellar biosynthetic protein FliO [Clostridium sp.]MCI1715396.1 flagellar biosynthetic protein FliO [Clostridium sp.]MCI1799813.1 flagellar biosynthetic protein FliO [Clostridium sp.]MCI1813579.1 flagellar biosynthetic protein FliO [Clostridium sp.]MCI1870631.1 flagellar biosynthetic protein FliO [Clostridium sp.]